jgi:hypothetical protein
MVFNELHKEWKLCMGFSFLCLVGATGSIWLCGFFNWHELGVKIDWNFFLQHKLSCCRYVWRLQFKFVVENKWRLGVYCLNRWQESTNNWSGVSKFWLYINHNELGQYISLYSKYFLDGLQPNPNPTQLESISKFSVNKILSTQLSFKYKIVEQKCNHICSTVKYIEQKWLK